MFSIGTRMPLAKKREIDRNDWVELVMFFKENDFTFEEFRLQLKKVKSLSFISEEEAFFVFIWAFERIDGGIFIGDEPINACKKRFKTKSPRSMYKRMAYLILIANEGLFCSQRDSIRVEIQKNTSLLKSQKGGRLLQILENL
jgi:hypothetical protein